MRADLKAYEQKNAEWLACRVEETTDEYQERLPSEWAEERRYLGRATTPQPGPFSFSATPYWVEVLDCFDPNSPVRHVAVQKGAQVAATVGILENVVGYQIDYIRTQPVLFYTADQDLAKTRMTTNVVPMIQQSGMGHLIRANDEMRKAKRGLTDEKVEWDGGGYLLPLGANSSNKQRSMSAPVVLRDEISGWPLTVGRDADPLKLTETRTNSYEATRKILDLSTPNEEETCAISKQFKLGDQRYYQVPCKHCHEFQVLKFRGDLPGGVRYGLIWDSDEDGRIVPGTTRYVCKHCSGEMTNDDKLPVMAAGKWVPTATPSRPNFRSYHLSALYAPYFARTWEAIAIAWCEAWDDGEDRVRSPAALQVFYNNDLGMAYTTKVEKLEEHDVSPHTRDEYSLGSLPHDHPELNAGGRVEILTMAVDVHPGCLHVKIAAWAPSWDHGGYAHYVVEYFKLRGPCESPDGQPWRDLEDIIDTRRYRDRDREYPLTLTIIDASGSLAETVYTFCSAWGSGVIPVRGRDKPIKGARYAEFDLRENATGVRFVAATVDIYKDRWSAALKRTWSGQGHMPRNNWSAPHDLPKGALRELTVEHKRKNRDPKTGRMLGTYWHRPSGAANELWDLLVYNTVALELVAMEVSTDHLGLEYLSWPEFWQQCATGLYWTPC